MSAAVAATGRAPVLVMAVGNILRRDDGFADAVLKALEGEDLPAGVELFDAGTSIIELMDVFQDRDKLIVIDAIDGGGSPGTLYRFSPQEVDSEAVALHDIHQVGLLETLKLGELIDCTPGEAVVIGVQPRELGLGIGLSPELIDAVPKAVELIRKEIALSF
ncbi:HyaD/HybD family hydrogenase maturation endopeptidase [Geoalkalibacter subterraneus]|nr:HyaD/HybD family hydrogenase maturation endopeptidase [Geoalkalibacter subterraneus]